MGEVEQFSGEKPNAPLDIHVYTGADASFVWYEDAGDTYAYETGECARVMLRWDDEKQKLTLSEREGSFEGMVMNRTLKIKIHTLEGVKNVEIEFNGTAIEV
jgi:alpha-D-xyloside xylohydrolase